MKLISKKDNFSICFNCITQTYSVYKDDILLITDKFKYSDVKSYID